ncbi:MAG TPA: CBS domain-containing protein [Actinomycetota bacterium]|nr:CBS domain-containing protein [Actinomycetota bacterium]
MGGEADLARGVMTSEVVTVGPDDPVETAIRAMLDHDIGAVVVARDGEPLGLFTERDVTRRVLDGEDLLHRPVSEVMSAPAVTVAADTEVVEIFKLMNDRRIRRLPIVEDGKLVGIVTERDLLRWVDAVARA